MILIPFLFDIKGSPSEAKPFSELLAFEGKLPLSDASAAVIMHDGPSLACQSHAATDLPANVATSALSITHAH